MRSPRKTGGHASEAVGTFFDTSNLEAAIDELLISGFDPVELTLLSDASVTSTALQRIYAKVARRTVEPRSEALDAQIDRGGLPLWVRASNAYDASRAAQILSGRYARDVHIEPLPAARLFPRGLPGRSGSGNT